MWIPEHTKPVSSGSTESWELCPDSSPRLSYITWKKNAEYAEYTINHLSITPIPQQLTQQHFPFWTLCSAWLKSCQTEATLSRHCVPFSVRCSMRERQKKTAAKSREMMMIGGTQGSGMCLPVSLWSGGGAGVHFKSSWYTNLCRTRSLPTVTWHAELVLEACSQEYARVCSAHVFSYTNRYTESSPITDFKLTAVTASNILLLHNTVCLV